MDDNNGDSEANTGAIHGGRLKDRLDRVWRALNTWDKDRNKKSLQGYLDAIERDYPLLLEQAKQIWQLLTRWDQMYLIYC